jgi:Bacteriophage tail sheath protein
VRTDIAGFFGFTERGPVVTTDPNANCKDRLASAVKLNSWNDFRNIFGGFLVNGYLAYAVRGFFGTGGQTCYVVRVGAAKTPATTSMLPLPAAVPSKFLTYLSADVTPGKNQIQLDSSDVVSVGDLIAIGDPDRGECLSVASVDTDQTITVLPAPISAHSKGDIVYSITGSGLSAAAPAGSQDLQLIQSGCFANGDLVLVQGAGLSEIHVLIGAPAGSTIYLSRALDQSYPAGSIVRRYPAAFTLSAASAGGWGDRVRLHVTPIDPGNAIRNFSLRIIVDRGDDQAQPVQEEFYPLLTLLDPNDPTPSNIFQALKNSSQIVTIAAPATIDATNGTLLYGVGPLANGTARLQGGSDGTLAGSVTGADFQNALDVLGLVDEVAILCCPDAVGPPPAAPVNPTTPAPPPPSPCQATTTVTAPPANPPSLAPPAGWQPAQIQQAMIAQCAKLRYRVAVLDTPMSATADSTSMQPMEVLNWLQAAGFDPQSANFAAAYYPWLQVPDELEIEGPNRAVPPCGHVAGGYAFTDIQYGVQKPPANVELNFVSDLDLAVSDQQQGPLNSAGINVIRAFPGRGIRVWGARAISQDPIWRYIHTRRLLSMIEDSVEKATQWVVFRPNDSDLRRMLTHSLNVFLEAIWLRGGLQGDIASQGYFVKCNDINNPQASIDMGRLICQVGVAIAAPMEFIVFEMTRSVEGTQIVEA